MHRGQLAVDGVRPARGGDLVTGAGIARCFTGPVSEVVAVTQRNRHQQGEAGERAVPPPVPPAPAQFMCAAIGGIGGKTIVQGGVRGRSEEHTSELQSLMRISYAVFCLKKKTKHHLDNQQDTTLTTLLNTEQIYLQLLSSNIHSTHAY